MWNAEKAQQVRSKLTERSGGGPDDTDVVVYLFKHPAPEDLLDDTGVVVFMIKHGVKMPLDMLSSAIADLEPQVTMESAFIDPEARKRAVKEELVMLRRCVDAGGQIPPVSTIGGDAPSSEP
mmetsp:Transcript_11786/g.35363  ORF Transcript_11786/g.35363 Transcript_11786/m.35363 type:complete len:122 (+) Transcript_11786:264-629(+)